MFLKIFNKIREYNTIIIHRHLRPDGDALGSQIGLKLAIQATFPSKCVKVVGDTSERYNWIGLMDEVEDTLYQDALVIVVDTGCEKLISDTRYKKAKYVIKIDHHLPQGEYGDLAYIDTNADSCATIITELIKETPLLINKDVATSLFTGIVTDSGRFRYSQTNAKTFGLTSYLLGYGVNMEDVYSHLYTEKLSTVKLRAYLITKFKVTSKGLAYLINKKTDVEKYQIPIFDLSRGMVNIMAGIEGITVWANFTEAENGEVYCEFRSSGKNVNKVATMFGGGGHLQASGCTLSSILAVKDVINELNKLAGEKDD